MTPLWTTATAPSPPAWGCALASVAPPWVAPARVADTLAARRRLARQQGRQVGDAAGPLADVQAGAGPGGQPGAVVAPGLQAAETVEQDRPSLPAAGARHAATHA